MTGGAPPGNDLSRHVYSKLDPYNSSVQINLVTKAMAGRPISHDVLDANIKAIEASLNYISHQVSKKA